MTERQFFGRSEPGFEDTAFEPKSSHDFEDVGHLGHMSGFQTFSGTEFDFSMMDGVYEDEGAFDHDMFHGRDGAMFKAHGNLQYGARGTIPEPPSAQSSIIHSHGKNVRQQFGQITPPNDDVPLKSPSSKQPSVQHAASQESNKLSNEQRARNAANTRHSRSKIAKKKSEPSDSISDDDEGAQKLGKNLTVQREKNRVAAAKCRAKKKTANEQQEEMASQFGATNNLLTREIRDLKNQKTELQNFLLAHRPGVCECHGIHDYNFGQAQRLVMNARRHVAEPVESPSLESVFSGRSPGSDESGRFSAGNRPQMYSAFDEQIDPQFSQGTEVEPLHSHASTARVGQHMSHEFAEFLKSTPDGRAGFS